MKSRRARATDIPKKVKERVYERDNGRCIICHRRGIPNAHFIRRSQGGLGIEQNIVTLCLDCHNAFDNGFYRREIEEKVREYLRSKYENWKEENLIYKKGQK